MSGHRNALPTKQVSSRGPVLFWIAIGALILLLCINFWQLFAELNAISPRYLLTLQNAAEWRERDRVYRDARDSIDRALSMMKGNPEYAEIQARLLVDGCRFMDVGEQWQQWQDCQEQALLSLRLGLQQNPQWPYLWANLLLVKTSLRQFDEEFYQALDKSTSLGRNEFNVNRLLAYVGLVEWSRWQPETREPFRRALRMVNSVSPDVAASIASDTGQMSLYCLWTINEPSHRRLCAKKKRKTAL